MKKILFMLTALGAALLASACTLEPRYRRPEVPVAAGYPDAAAPAGDATLISIGNPFDPDLAVYPLLDTTLTGADPGVAAALNAGRQQIDPAQRDVAYRQFQQAYVLSPTMVCLVLASHT